MSTTLPAAYALARLPVPGKSPILLGIVAGSAFPQIATVTRCIC
jgi:ABC-type glycerol-3-phosphate transport system permease component